MPIVRKGCHNNSEMRKCRYSIYSISFKFLIEKQIQISFSQLGTEFNKKNQFNLYRKESLKLPCKAKVWNRPHLFSTPIVMNKIKTAFFLFFKAKQEQCPSDLVAMVTLEERSEREKSVSLCVCHKRRGTNPSITVPLSLAIASNISYNTTLSSRQLAQQSPHPNPHFIFLASFSSFFLSLSECTVKSFVPDS